MACLNSFIELHKSVIHVIILVSSVIVVFILSAPWWLRISGLWNLLDGWDWLWRELGLALMGRAILSKSLIICWWMGLCSLPVVWPEVAQSWCFVVPMEIFYILMAQRLKRLSAMQETWVRSLGREDHLEKEMATHSSILAWRISWMEEPGGLQSTGSQRVGHDWVTSHIHILDLMMTPSKRTYSNLLQLLGMLLPVPLTLWQATVGPHLHQRLQDIHRQVWLSLLWGHCSFLLGRGVYKILFVSSKSLFPLIFEKF